MPHELRPFVAVIAKRQRQNSDNAAWTILRNRWSTLVDSALALVSVAQDGRPYIAHRLAAARIVQAIAGALDPDTVIRTAMAPVMHSLSDPRRYLNDRAVVYQTARAVIKLSPGCMGRYYSHQLRRVRTVRLDMPPRVIEELGGQLIEAFGGAAAQLHRIEMNRNQAKQAEQRQLGEALQALQ